MHVLDELSYTFDHIWTNLLTQCTLVPVPVFCCFLFQVSLILKVLQKFGEKSDKNQRTGSFRNNQGGERGPPPGVQKPWWRALGGGRARWPPGHLVAPLPPLSPIYSP